MAYMSFFKTFKPKQFNYTPRFYDERKEALQNRIAQIKEEMGIEDEESKKTVMPRRTLTKGVMQQKMATNRKTQRKSSFRLFAITAILLILAYYLLYK